MTPSALDNVLLWFGLKRNNFSDIVNLRNKKFGHAYISGGEGDEIELASIPLDSVFGRDGERNLFTYLVELVLNTPINMSLYSKDGTVHSRLKVEPSSDEFNPVISGVPEWFYECVPTTYMTFNMMHKPAVCLNMLDPFMYEDAYLAYTMLTQPADAQAMLEERIEKCLVDALQKMFDDIVAFSKIIDLDVVYAYLTGTINRSDRETVLSELDNFAILWSSQFSISRAENILSEQTYAK